jgi:hypothetical protein
MMALSEIDTRFELCVCHTLEGDGCPFRSNESLAVPYTLYAPIASPLSNYPPRSVARSPPGGESDLHCSMLHSIPRALRDYDYVTSTAVDAEAATQRAMESARKTKSALLMDDGNASLMSALPVVVNIRRRRVCGDVRGLLVFYRGCR